MGDLVQFRPPARPATAMVRVSGENGAVHFASLNGYLKRRAEECADYRGPTSVAMHCLMRLHKTVQLAPGAVTCAHCAADVGRYLDVTDELLAEAIA